VGDSIPPETVGFPQRTTSSCPSKLSSPKEAFQEDKLLFRGNTEGLQGETACDRFLKKLRRQKWMVYSKEPFGEPEQVYGYLSR
jgi:hypothetical protein